MISSNKTRIHPVSLLFAFVLSAISLYLTQCGKSGDQGSAETIVARIGDKTISQNEFIRRAEYTLRPAYCRDDNYVHKKIVLNSLIAEKLLALEAGDDNEMTNNEEFQIYLQGRKEQAMRQWLYAKDIHEKVKLDSAQVNRAYDLAGRTYRVAFGAVSDSSRANAIAEKVRENHAIFEEIFAPRDSARGAPQREVAWNSPETRAVHAALFSGELKKNDIIGPLQVDEGHYLLIKIIGWSDRLAISDAQIRERRNEVIEKLTEAKVVEDFNAYVRNLMAGKTLEFAPRTFRSLVNIVGPYYLKTSQDKQAAFNQQFWGTKEGERELTRMGEQIETILDEPLFRIAGETWTVRDLERAIKIHPLVFRNRNLKKGEFAEQFKLAIVDMVRDSYITKQAYERRYDNVEAVKQNVEMWRDNLLFLYQQNRFLKSIGKNEKFNTEYARILESDLNPYVDRLQEIYRDVIEINTGAFEAIKLTRVDMIVIQRNAPFPVVVPGFPIITTDHMLDYGRKMPASSGKEE